MTMQTRILIVAFAAAAGASFGTAGVAAAQGPSKPPFSGTYSRPAVSPYLMLSQQGSGGGINGQTGAQQPLVYQQLIQPQLQQQQQVIEQQSQTRQLGRLQNQVQQIQRDTRGRQIDETIRPTGHASTYQNLSHFYPRR
jgi:hypothetical protein